MTDCTDDVLDHDCVVTFEQTSSVLAEVEQKIATDLGLHGSPEEIRNELLRLDRQGELVETNLVADWHDLFASYLDWTAQ